MNANEVCALITDMASRFDYRNPQQFRYLVSRLSAEPAQVVAQGLLAVFTSGTAPPTGSPAQELAGRLLAELSPAADFDLMSVLRASLARYELSVEQFPVYLGFVCGGDAVLSALQHLEAEPLSPAERRSLKSLRFWLSDGLTVKGSDS